MFVVVAYDIVDNKKRRMIAKILVSYGERVQKSVFECLEDDGRYLKMKGAIEKCIDPEVDSVRYYFLCKRCVGDIEVSGLGRFVEDEKVVIV